MGKYEVLKLLGKGSYGTVFKSQIVHNGKEIDVAVKRFEKLDDIFAENAQYEFRILQKIKSHDNIINLLDFSWDKEFFYLVTEYGDYGDLEKYLTSGNIPGLDVKLQIMENSATGLYFLHQNTPPIIHRDIKLENIIIKKKGSGIVAKLCDFGLSTLFQLDSDKLLMSTKAGKGTYAYLAPELLVYGRKQYDASLDVFSLGLVLMVLLNYTENFKKLEPFPESLHTGKWLVYGQYLQSVREGKEPPPVIFQLKSEDKWPVTELKALITSMVAYEASDRVSSEHVMKAMTNIRGRLSGEVLKDREQESIMDVQSQLENVNLEKSELQSQLTEALKQLSVTRTQVREKDKRLQDNDVTVQKQSSEIDHYKQLVADLLENQTAAAADSHVSKPEKSKSSQAAAAVESLPVKTAAAKRSVVGAKTSSKAVQVKHKAVSRDDKNSQEASYKDKSMKSIHSFRLYSDLKNIHSNTFNKVKDFNIKNSCDRICYFNNQLYLPSPGFDCIRVYTAEGELTRTLQLTGVSELRQLHPINQQHLVLAAETGLYVIDADGCVIETLRTGHYVCVHADDNYIVANSRPMAGILSLLFTKTDKITVMNSTPPYKTHAEFSHNNDNVLSVLVSGDRVYVTDCDTHQVTVYTTQGERVGRYGRSWMEHTGPGGLFNPHVCASDNTGSVLVVDTGHNRLQVMSATGEWTVLTGVHVRRPGDVVIVGDKLFLLHYYDRSLTIFTI